jgi:hypothetical protein
MSMMDSAPGAVSFSEQDAPAAQHNQVMSLGINLDEHETGYPAVAA